MLERIIENWLDKASERSFQLPYCYMLSAEGHTIIHLTRHCGMEMGKDIITIAPDGTPCAFQLKAGNISLNKWQKDVGPQIYDLVVGKINHQSVDSPKHHKSYLVTNGNIVEEVSRAINDMNQTWESQGQPYLRLKTIVRGQLIEQAKKLGTDLWPSELTDIKTLLEMFLESGRGVLPKEKLASLFESTFPLKPLDNGKVPSKAHCKRSIASAAILCAIATSSFSNENNHVAEIEAWMMYLSYVFALAEKWELPAKAYKGEFEIATRSIYNSLANLCDEIREQGHLVEGDPLADSYVYKVRVTWLLGLMSIYALWRRSDEVPKDETDDFLREFCKAQRHQLVLWGEAAIPQFLAFFWHFRKINSTPDPDSLLSKLIASMPEHDSLLSKLIASICERNRPKGNTFLAVANPYYEAEDILPHILSPILGPTERPLTYDFRGKSYALEGLVHLFVRRNWKQRMKRLWPDVTRIANASFEPENFSDFYRWRSQEGTNKTVVPKRTQEWGALKALALESAGTNIPPFIKDYPILLLLFLCVYPHRMNAEILRWLDTQMQQVPRP